MKPRAFGYQSHEIIDNKVFVTAKKLVFDSNGFSNYIPNAKIVVKEFTGTPAQFELALRRWETDYIQNAFRMYSVDEREFLLNGLSLEP